MMFFDVYLKNYVLLLFLGITVIFIYMNTENNWNKLLLDLKETTQNEIPYYSPKILKLESSDFKNLKSINFQEICTKYNLTSFLERKNFLYSSKNQALYCWIRKIASTSFTKIFSDMEGRHVTDHFDREVEFLSPKSIKLLKSVNRDEDILKFLIVRHPFERLVSSYRDRIEDNTKFTAQAWMYVPKIFYLTRPELFRSNSTTGSTLEKMFYIDRRLKLVPTFEEFVTYLIHESPANYDHHWNQYYRHCSLCGINYNFILKLEDHSPKQINYIFSRLNIQKENIINLHITSGGLTDFQRTCEYFKNLPRETILKLYEKYKIDFKMFDYEIKKYLRCVVKKRTLQNRTL